MVPVSSRTGSRARLNPPPRRAECTRRTGTTNNTERCVGCAHVPSIHTRPIVRRCDILYFVAERGLYRHVSRANACMSSSKKHAHAGLSLPVSVDDLPGYRACLLRPFQARRSGSPSGEIQLHELGENGPGEARSDGEHVAEEDGRQDEQSLTVMSYR